MTKEDFKIHRRTDKDTTNLKISYYTDFNRGGIHKVDKGNRINVQKDLSKIFDTNDMKVVRVKISYIQANNRA